MSETPSNPLCSDADCYRLLRAQIEFEDNLIVQRLNWFMASQSFLFTAYAITLNSPTTPAWPVFGEQQRIIFHLIPVIALAACGLIYCAVIAGIMAMVHVHRQFNAQIPETQRGRLPRLQGSMSTRVLGMAAPLGMPVVFAAVWAWLLIRGLA